MATAQPATKSTKAAPPKAEPAKKVDDGANVVTPEFRVSYPHVFKAHSGFEGQAAKFSITMLFDKGTDISALKKVVNEALVKKFGPKEKWPKKLKLPFRDGDEEKADTQPEYANTIFVNATSTIRPGVIDQRMAPLTEEDNQFYPGCYARAELQAYGFDTAGNRGVAFGLQNLQKLRDGDPLGARRRAATDVFDAVDDTSEDEESYELPDEADDE